MADNTIKPEDLKADKSTVAVQAATIAAEVGTFGKPLIYSKIFWVQVIVLALSLVAFGGINTTESQVATVGQLATIAFRYMNKDITGIV